MSVKPTPAVVRFWRKVDVSGDCWLWTGGRSSTGYGQISVGGKGGRNIGAHRFAFELFYGPIPVGQSVLHSCDNRACVNPAHLRAGSQADNMRDRSERGRNPNSLKSACPRGHEYDEENTYIGSRGNRMCRTCHRERQRARTP